MVLQSVWPPPHGDPTNPTPLARTPAARQRTRLMRIPNSFLTGLFVAPLGVAVAGAVTSLSSSPAQARTGIAVAIGAGCALCAWLPSSAGMARRITAAALLLLSAMAALFFSGILPPSPAAQLAVLAAAPALGLCLLGGGRPLLPATLVGACVGLLATEAFLAPRIGLTIPVLACTAGLIWVRWQPSPANQDDESVRRLRGVDLAAAGLLTAFAIELFRPIASQHLSGAGWSHAAIAGVVLAGAGIGSLFGGSARGGALLRIVAPIVFVAASWMTLHTLAAAADVRTFLVNEDTLTAKDRLLTFVLPHPRLEELARAQLMLALAALAGGFWLRVASNGGRGAGNGAILFLSIALGADLSHRVLENDAWTETVLRAPASLVRRGPLETTDEWSLGPNGALRSVRDNTHADGRPFLMWQGRRASRPPMFRLLEEEELLLCSKVSHGGDLLVYGVMTANHRRAFEDTSFTSYTSASELPSLDEAGTAREPRTTVRPTVRADDGERFDAAVLLSTPFMNAEAAGMHTEERLRALRERLHPDGCLVVWVDLRATPTEALAAIANAVGAVFDEPRAWITMDGGVGPFVAIAGGAAGGDMETTFSVPIPFAALTGDRTRVQSVRDPVLQTLSPGPAKYRPLAVAADLRALITELRARGEPEELNHLLEALAVHSENYFPLENPNDPMERHRVTEEECQAVIRAVHAAPNREIVLNQARQFLVLAIGTRNYERLDRVLQAMLEHHPDDPALRYASGRSAFDLLDYESAVEDLEISLREDRENIAAYRLLGVSYSRLDPPDYTSAISSLHAALELDSEDLETIRALGIVLYDADRKLEALQYLERAAMSDTTDEEVVGRLRNLR